MTSKRLEPTYFGRRVLLENHGDEDEPDRWAFVSIQNGETVQRFAGIPNKWLSRQSAVLRAWWRCKWMAEGTFEEHYK